MKTPTIEECEMAIGEPAEKWAGRCFEIASKIVDAGLVPGGEAVYGHWLGEISSKSRFADRRHVGFVQHGWIWVEGEGIVIDPTRWAFEARTPYIYVGEEPDDWSVFACENCGLVEDEHHHDDLDHCDDYTLPSWPYDEGGNQWRAEMRIDKEAPMPAPGAERFQLLLDGEAALVVAMLLKQPIGTEVTDRQIFWLANMSYQAFGKPYAGRIYEAICAAGDFIEYIPIDNRKKAARESGFTRK